MIDEPMLFCGVGWMKYYKGIQNDKSPNGGSYVKEHGFGHECYNFLNSNGHYYGYVEHNDSEIHIEKLGADRKEESISGVTVVWFACRPDTGGLNIVGWYNNATIYRGKEGKPVPLDAMDLREKKEVNAYSITSTDVVLLDEEERTFRISGPGRARLWYDEEDKAKSKVKEYIKGYERDKELGICEIEKGTELLTGGEREALVKQRINQSKFRMKLLARYDGCCLCGVKNPDLLIASHIKPWSVSDRYEKLDEDNGLLLCPNHDKLFDAGLISFDNDGVIIISDKVSGNDRVFMNIREGDKIELTAGNRTYLKYHRKLLK